MSFQYKYYKDPGLIIDVIKVLSLKLNSKYFLGSASLLSKNNPQEIEQLKTLLNSFETPPKELLLFFYKPTENFYNFMTCYVEKMLCQDFPQVTLSTLFKKLNQSSSLQQEILSFYLSKHDLTETSLVSLLRTDKVLPDNIKFYLLSFQLDPKSFYSLLIAWLQKYASFIETEFLPNCQSFLPEAQTLKILIDHAYPDRSSFFSTRPILFSVCSVLQDYLYIHSSAHHNWLITGCRFQKTVDAILQLKQTIDLQEICEALGDPIRLNIINHLYTQKESTRQQMLDSLIVPVTSSHHHIEKLKRAGLIISHRQNNNHIYSLNYPVFNEVANIFKLYSKGGNTL